MADNTDVGDKTLDKTTDSKAGDGAAARDEASGGMKGLADNTKSYYEARKGGMRDKDTQEIFGKQPEFFDSSMAANQRVLPGDKAADSGSKDKSAVADKVDNKAAQGAEKEPTVRDEKDRVTHVNYPDGSTADVKYGNDNKPSEIKTGGETWKKDEKGGGWDSFDAHGKKTTHLDGEMQVNERGDIIAKQKGGYTETYSPDGTMVKEGFPDKHKETYYEGGRSMTEDANGNRAYYQKDGTKTVYGDDKTTVTHPDKSVSEMYPDGRVKTTDPHGKVSEYKPDKSDWHFPEEGQPAQTEKGELIFDNDNGDRMYQNPKTGQSKIYRKGVYAPEVYQDGKRQH